jgi:outer membrane protein OmpA-like peptidoglycan-associated protein
MPLKRLEKPMGDAPVPPKAQDQQQLRNQRDRAAKPEAKRESRIDATQKSKGDGSKPVEPGAGGQEKPAKGPAKESTAPGTRETRSKGDAKGWDVLKTHKPDKSRGGDGQGLERLKQTLASADANPNRETPTGSKIDRMNTLMKDANNQSAKADKADRTREVRNNPEPAGDRAEKARVANPKDGIGFGHASDTVDRKALNALVGREPKERLDAVKKGQGWVEVTTTASRDGSAQSNQNLTDRRGDNLTKALVEDLGIDPQQIFVKSLGETEAKESGKPDNKDDAEDRTGRITFHEDKHPEPGVVKGDVDSAYKSASDALPKFEVDRNAQEQGKMVVDHAKKLAENTIKEGAKNPALIEEIFVKELIKEGGKYTMDQVRWMGNKLADDLGSKDLKANLQANAVPGMQDALAKFAGVAPKADGTRSALFRGEKSAVYRLARDTYTESLGKLSDRDKINVRQVMRSDQRKSLETKLERDWSNYSGRGVRQ